MTVTAGQTSDSPGGLQQVTIPSTKTPVGVPPQVLGDQGAFASLASGSDRTKFEQLKADSGYLKEPLATELANDANHFGDGAVQLLKFHGSYQQDNRENRQKGQDKDWQMMLRLRSPGGRIPASQFLAMDDLADRLGNGRARSRRSPCEQRQYFRTRRMVRRHA